MRAALAAALVLALVPAAAQAAPRLTKVGDFAQPVHVAGPPGDPSRLFVVEKAGRVQVLVDGVRAAAPFLDLDASVDDTGERGLLSIAFAPDYAASGRFYVFYTANDGTLTVREGQRGADPQRGAIGRTLFTIPHPLDNHNGGQLAFGPDGLLYVSVGDGGTQGDPEGDAQNTASLLGKILRVAPSGTTPSVWAWGLRNPWRFSFDRQTGAMVIGDVGGGVNEEVSVAPAGGGNFGWNVCEGLQPSCPAGSVLPALTLPHSAGYSGVIGGFVVRDPGVPSLLGRYVFGDLAKPTLMSAALGAEPTPRTESSLPVAGASSLGEDGCGRVYVASLDGPVSRIEEGNGTVCTGGVATPAPAAPTAPMPSFHPGCGLKVRVPRVQRAGRVKLRLRARRACTVALRSRGFRARRVALAAGRARVVRITPTRKRLRKLERGDRVKRVRIRIRTRTADGGRGAQRVRARVR